MEKGKKICCTKKEERNVLNVEYVEYSKERDWLDLEGSNYARDFGYL